MESLWNDQEAAKFEDDLGLRVYTSQLLGRNKELVLHGGGNTSVKIEQENVLGEVEKILYVKGSGWDLETIDRPGFAPVKLAHLIALSKLPELSDPQMVNELKTHMTNASAPTPSVEAILHATLPYKFVDHTHANAVVTVTNTPAGPEYISEIFVDEEYWRIQLFLPNTAGGLGTDLDPVDDEVYIKIVPSNPMAGETTIDWIDAIRSSDLTNPQAHVWPYFRVDTTIENGPFVRFKIYVGSDTPGDHTFEEVSYELLHTFDTANVFGQAQERPYYGFALFGETL